MARLTVFKRLRMNFIVAWWWEVRDYVKFLFKFLPKRFLQLLGHFETGKGVIVEGLVAKRGRYARPFIHTGMTGLFLIGLLLTPVISKAVNDENVDIRETTLIGRDMSLEITTSMSIKPRANLVTYIVQSGDTISSIANKFNISIDSIRWQNDLKSIDSIDPGQKLEIPPVTGMVHKVKRGETIYSIAKKYDVSAQQIINWPFNSYSDDEVFALVVGQNIIVPDGVKPQEKLWDPKHYVARITPDAGVVSAIGQFVWPTSGLITQRFVWYHQAIDIANSRFTNILAADSGTVITAGWPNNWGYGNRIIIDHGNGYTTLYAHLAEINVGVGQTVNRGNVIGKMGSSGRSTGSHLHFEIRKGGILLNPLNFLK